MMFLFFRAFFINAVEAVAASSPTQQNDEDNE